MNKIPITLLLIAIVFTSGCLGISSTPTSDATTPTEGDISTQTTSDVPTPVTQTTPTKTANVGTSSRSWDVKVWNMRSTAFTATLHIVQNDTGEVVFDEQIPLKPDESRKLTFDYPVAGNYTLTVEVMQSAATQTSTERRSEMATATGGEENKTVTTYGYEILTVPPSVEVIVLLQDDGSVDVYLESA